VVTESRSFSKSTGFTGLRMAYTVVPREAQGRSRAGDVVSLNQLWLRRQSTKSNGPPYVISGRIPGSCPSLESSRTLTQNGWPRPGFSTAPRFCRYRAASQQTSAQARPAHQPASTSVG
jgi:hypothetical protein